MPATMGGSGMVKEKVTGTRPLNASVTSTEGSNGQNRDCEYAIAEQEATLFS